MNKTGRKYYDTGSQNAESRSNCTFFNMKGRLIQDIPFGNGHINDTYLLTFEVKRMGILKVILQKMNKNVFKKPCRAYGEYSWSDFLSSRKKL